MKQVLLLIDIQNDYFPNGKMELTNSISAGENAKKVLQKFRDNNDFIIHIQHIATRPDAAFFLPDTYGSEIHPLVEPENDEKIIIKHFPNSFQQTELLEYLQKNNIQKLIIAGMMTHMCVESTARAAKDLGFIIEIVGDACATKDLEINNRTVKAEDVQTAFLSALSYYYSDITETSDYV
ncbi:cysteine hydrolase [Chryseobacterium oranimense]|uniref:cysteine hydrolase family protein n=1 Tax=Chryseobacterium oranimense TaxID=421058 RepID=UPI0021AE3F2A|nr:cysteine hydrolase family protein [Chryseobacterium oranimense]UWX62312.1 cysteine hydrolase [Chryseobacterium oranimense]